MDGDARKIAVILGVNGQDGSYAAEYFLFKGYYVLGIGRQLQSKWLTRSELFRYEKVDLAEFSSVEIILKEIRPSVIINAAAIHGAATYSYEEVWSEAHLVNTGLTNCILEYIRRDCPECFYLFLSSSKVFNTGADAKILESSPRVGSCIYSITKNAATDLVDYYRKKHGLKASVVWTFNHESPRRGPNYFISKIVGTLEKALLDSNFKSEIYTLDFWCDWGDAEEYMNICGEIAIRGINQNFVLATGTTLWARDFVEKLFASYSLVYSDHFLEVNTKFERDEPWIVDISRLKLEMGLGPCRSIYDVCDSILKSKRE